MPPRLSCHTSCGCEPVPQAQRRYWLPNSCIPFPAGRASLKEHAAHRVMFWQRTRCAVSQCPFDDGKIAFYARALSIPCLRRPSSVSSPPSSPPSKPPHAHLAPNTRLNLSPDLRIVRLRKRCARMLIRMPLNPQQIQQLVNVTGNQMRQQHVLRALTIKLQNQPGPVLFREALKFVGQVNTLHLRSFPDHPTDTTRHLIPDSRPCRCASMPPHEPT